MDLGIGIYLGTSGNGDNKPRTFTQLKDDYDIEPYFLPVTANPPLSHFLKDTACGTGAIEDKINFFCHSQGRV